MNMDLKPSRPQPIAASTHRDVPCIHTRQPAQSEVVLVWRQAVRGSSANNTCVVPLGKTWEQRAPLTGQQIVEATQGMAPFEGLAVSIGDSACNADLAFAVPRTTCRARVIPDYIFSAWPSVGIASFDSTARELALLAKRSVPRPVCGWAGTTSTSKARVAAVALMRRNPGVFALHEVKPLKVIDARRRLSLGEQVGQWSCLVDLVGGGYSGRVPLLLHTGRPLLYVERQVRAFYDSGPDAIKPWKHYVPAKADLSDLVEKARWILEHREEAQRIAAQGQAHALQHLTRAAAIAAMRARILEVVAQRPHSPHPREPASRDLKTERVASKLNSKPYNKADPCASVRTIARRRACLRSRSPVRSV